MTALTEYDPGLDNPGSYHTIYDRTVRLSLSLNNDNRALHLEVAAATGTVNMVVFFSIFGWGWSWVHYDEQGRRIDRSR